MRILIPAGEGQQIDLSMSYPDFLKGPVKRQLRERGHNLEPQQAILHRLSCLDLMRGAKLKAALAEACRDACGLHLQVQLSDEDVAHFYRRSFHLVPAEPPFAA